MCVCAFGPDSRVTIIPMQSAEGLCFRYNRCVSGLYG